MFVENILSSKSAVRLLRFFSLNPNRQFFPKELSELTGLGFTLTTNKLTELERGGILESEKRGRMLFYKLNKENNFANNLMTLFSIEQTINKPLSPPVISILSELVLKLVNALFGKLYFVAVYGSVASGETRKGSDIDVFIVLDTPADKQNVRNLCGQISERFGVDITPVVLTEEEIKRSVKEPLLRDITKESILIYGDKGKFRNLIAGYIGRVYGQSYEMSIKEDLKN